MDGSPFVSTIPTIGIPRRFVSATAFSSRVTSTMIAHAGSFSILRMPWRFRISFCFTRRIFAASCFGNFSMAPLFSNSSM